MRTAKAECACTPSSPSRSLRFREGGTRVHYRTESTGSRWRPERALATRLSSSCWVYWHICPARLETTVAPARALVQAVEAMECSDAPRVDLVETLVDLHERYQRAARPREARLALLHALGLARQGWGTSPGKRERDCSYRLAAALLERDMFDEAEETAVRALRLSEEMEADAWDS